MTYQCYVVCYVYPSIATERFYLGEHSVHIVHLEQHHIPESFEVLRCRLELLIAILLLAAKYANKSRAHKMIVDHGTFQKLLSSGNIHLINVIRLKDVSS